MRYSLMPARVRLNFLTSTSFCLMPVNFARVRPMRGYFDRSWERIGRTRANIWQISPSFVETCQYFSKSGRIWSQLWPDFPPGWANPGKFGRDRPTHRPNLADINQIWAGFGRFRRFRPTLEQEWPNLDRFRPSFVNFDQIWPSSTTNCRSRQTLHPVRRVWSVKAMSIKFGWKSGRRWPNLARRPHGRR